MTQPTEPRGAPSERARPPVPTQDGDEPDEDEATLQLSKGDSPIRVRAVTQQSWDEAVQRVILPVEKSPWQREQLLTLLRTDYHLCRRGALEQALQAILQDTAKALGAQRGAIALAHEPESELRVHAVTIRHRGVSSREGFSNTLARRCFERGESLLCHDVRADLDLNAAVSVMRGSMASMICALLRSPRRRLGVLHLDRGPFQQPFTADDMYLADAIAAKASVGIESAQLAQQQQDQFIQTLTTLARTVDARDRCTGTHAQRVTEYALCLAGAMGLPEEEVQRIRVGTPLHDIGKIGIPDAILNKPGKLTPDEFAQMKEHPARGVVILEGYPALLPVLPIVRSHHERWDGKGYPDGLAGERVAREARVVAVADVFDALTSLRPYRTAMPTAEAFAEIGRHAGTQFDPACAQAFLAVGPQIEARFGAFNAGPAPAAGGVPGGPSRKGWGTMNGTGLTGFRKAAGYEPLPGYRLVGPLGRGGFGEVWKCEVPGGLFKAVKFVRGGEEAPGGQLTLLQQELEAFQSVKAVRHPFILSIERVELVEGEMVTVMELADRNLQDRLAECQAAGLPGVPRDELLAFFLEAAEALDVMNAQYGLLHLDIKPTNLFVVSNHLKVGDFGLVHRLGQFGPEESRREGGVTPLYVAPEILQGDIHRNSDQYNLALAFQELLTGVHPCAGDHSRQVMMRHLMGQPNLDPLPEADRPWVARALSKDPDQRFPSCLTFVLSLLAGREQAEPAAVWRGASGPAAPGPRDDLNRADDTHPGPGLTHALRRLPPQTAAPAAPAPAAPAGVLAGHEVLDCLGRGSLGEVWSVRAADGRTRLARLPGPDVGGAGPARQRLTALLGTLRHRALPAVEAADGPGGQAVLLTDAAGRTLQDRFRECHEAGGAGIPRDELLELLGEAAEALDALRGRHDIQHLGLTPRHLLLADDRLRVADFGLLELVRRAGGRLPSPAGGHYLAPELAEGGVSPACDQFSLALIYAEMLTGVHPRLARGRASAGRGVPKLALDFLPAADREILGRALDPDPGQRFPCCVDLVAALEMATNNPVPRVRGRRRMPRILPFAHLRGGKAASEVLPSPGQFRDAVFAAATRSDALCGAPGALQCLRRAGNVWEGRFPMKVLPGVARLKVAALREEWGAHQAHEDESCFRLHLREAAAGFWQRRRGQPGGLEVEVRLLPGRGHDPSLVEVVVAVRPLGDGKGPLARKLPELGPQRARARDQLQNVIERRADTRWPADARVHVYPVAADGDVGPPVEGACRDVSPRGLRFGVPSPPAPGYVYLHFPETPGLAGFVLLAKIIRVEGGAGERGGGRVPPGDEPPSVRS